MERLIPSVDQKVYEYLIDHISFPCKLPQRSEKQLANSKVFLMDENDPNFLTIITNVLDSFRKEPLGYYSSLYHQVLSTFKEWSLLQSDSLLNKRKVHMQISSLNPGDTAVFYLKHQNACLILSMLPKDSLYPAVISCFQPSVENVSIMSVSGELSLFYPEISYYVKSKEIISSQAFANQISALANIDMPDTSATNIKKGVKNVEVRDVVNPRYVVEWLTAVASADSPMSDYPVPVVKKLRDDVLWKGALLPFRRSPMWISIKAVLQIMLCNIYDKECGKTLYKLIMCRVLGSLCHYAVEIKHEILLQMIQKLAKRLYKIEKNPKDLRYDLLVSMCLESCFMTIQSIRNHLDFSLERILMEKRAFTAKLDIRRIQISDKIHANLKCLPEIFRLRAIKVGASTLQDTKPASAPRNKSVSFPDVDYLDRCPENELSVVLYDIEKWVRYHINAYTGSSNSKNLFRLMKKYIDKASSFYKSDPRGYSRMTLTAIHIICILNFIASQKISLLCKYEIGIDTEVFKYLLLPNAEDMDYAYMLRDYINESKIKSEFPSLVHHSNTSSDSFASNYYDKSHKMKQAIKTIVLEALRECKQKKFEYDEILIRYQSLKLAISRSTCDYYTDKRNVTRHDRACKKCKMENDSKRLSVAIFEWPLPSCGNCIYKKVDFLRQFCNSKIKCKSCSLEKKLVMFELLIPRCIATLRDSLHVFYTQVVQGTYVNVAIKALWIKQEKLLKFAKNYQNCLTFGSTTKSFIACHYKFFNIHRASDIDCFFKPNGLNIRLSDINSNGMEYRIIPYDNFIDFCSFKAVSPYKSLQFSINWVSHTENEVISKQYSCSTHLELSEFIKFGFFRSGCNLQMLNLLDAIETRGLSFNHQSVCSLISQSLWQLGINSFKDKELPNHIKYPLAHQECSNNAYMLQMGRSLQQYLEVVSKNWNEHLIMLNIVVISTRLLSLAPNTEIFNIMLQVVREARKVCLEWKEKIEEILFNARSIESQQLNVMKEKLLEICCFGVLTYSIDSRHISDLLNSTRDATNWMQFMSKIYDINVLFKLSNAKDSCFRTNLMRMVTLCMLDIENQFMRIFSVDKGRSLTEFARIKWGEAMNGVFGAWTAYADSYFYKCHFTSMTSRSVILLQIGLDGAFLVQGQPVGKLPGEIILNQLFKGFFTDTDFDIQPGSGGIGTYTTQQLKISEDLAVNYTFFLKDTDFIILEHKEIRGRRTDFQLIPRSVFSGCFPSSFINDHSHWLNKDEDIIEFRPKLFTDSKYHSEIFFRLNLKSKILRDNAEKALIDFTSNTFQEIFYKIMYRMELENHTHIYSVGEKLSIELPRFNLRFDVLPNGQIMSHEFSGMMISDDQRLDTLLGLEEGLVICDVPTAKGIPSKKKLLVPHGTIQIFKDKAELHQSIEIIAFDLRVPAFYSFDIDERLRILRAGENQAAWLYLAWLHASTSHILHDPFLQQTGTSRALQILQSAHCWSCKPLSEESAHTLIEISKLSPKRSFYPPTLKSMQTVKWPNGISSLAAHEAYQHIAKKIFEDSQKQAFAFKIEGKEKGVISFAIESDILLSAKAYHRNRIFLHELDPSFERIIGEKDKVKSLIRTRDMEMKDQVENARKIMTESYFPSSFPTITQFLEFNTINGRSEFGFKGKKLTKWIPASREFYNHWIDLYMLAIADSTETSIRFTMILSLFAYLGLDLNDLLVLQYICKNKKYFININPPEYPGYYLRDYTYSKQKIITILCNNFIETRQFMNKFMKQKKEELDPTFLIRVGKEYKQERDRANIMMESLISDSWPNKECPVSLYEHKYLPSAIELINECFENWYKNKGLGDFLDCLMAKYMKLNFKNLPNIQNDKKTPTIPSVKVNFPNYIPFNPTIDFSQSQQLYTNSSEEHFKLQEDAFNIYQSGDYKPGFSHFFSGSQEFLKTPSEPPQFPIALDSEGSVTQFLLQELKISWDLYNQNHLEQNTSEVYRNLSIQIFQKKRNDYDSIIEQLHQQLLDIFTPQDLIHSILHASGLWPSLNPSFLLSQLLDSPSSPFILNRSITDLIGALAVMWVLHQRVIRCMSYLQHGELFKTLLLREIDCTPHSEWSPKDYPQWLILELEMDIMIRPVQVKVAKHMMSPPDNTNTVTQLNMGEGKTAVIIPMLVAALANGVNLVRIVVLRPLFNMNYSSLVQKLGGILNRRVYAFPCRRDMEFNTDNVLLVDNLYKECQEMKGVVITLPEHCMSFQLKGIEKCREGSHLGLQLIRIQNWLELYSRDILDESDEILSVKYQLVYSVGKQAAVSAGNLRWEVSQAVLALAKKHFDFLKEKWGEDAIEYYKIPKYVMAFPYFRLLSPIAYQELCELVCMDILKGRSNEICFLELKQSEIEIVKQYILQNEVGEECRKQIKIIFKNDKSSVKVVQILRGLFTYEVLFNSLGKRWRVDFGVNYNNTKLMQAVPYRAKDVPAERAQFEHPDIVILLTQLSYYYSGLSESQLDEVFKYLSAHSSGPQEYERWIKYLPEDLEFDESISEFSGINLCDIYQKYEFLYPIMKMHPLVINYWLNIFVYPREAKQFSGRLSRSAWDICRKKKLPLTGFSGTNDSKILIPLNTNYSGIEELRHTNGSLISKILLPENNKCSFLAPESSGYEILERIAKIKSLKLLLDVGALMLSLNNENVAKVWLGLRPDMEAAVFFRDNDLVVVNRKGEILDFEMSTYRGHLDHCVIYLDDCHTRGTDLKIPRGTIGAVTLGKGVSKDKLMQACMRMRMLGDGHSVHFYASHEVHNQISKIAMGGTIGSLEVIKWAIQNSSSQSVNGFIYWASQGVSFCRKEVIRMRYAQYRNAKEFGETSVEKEDLDISSLYNPDRISDYIKNIIARKTETTRKKLKIEPHFIEKFNNRTRDIFTNLEKYVATEKKYSQMHDDEQEQEVEFEVEQEQERIKERPKELQKAMPRLEDCVIKFATYGILDQFSSKFMHLPLSIRESSIFPKIQPKAWSPALFTTEDFSKTVTKNIFGDDFLRPARWVAFTRAAGNLKVLVLSGFEANELKYLFNDSCVSLMMLIPRVRQGQLASFSTFRNNIPQSLLEQLSVFAGSQYFDNWFEQEAYLNFIGYCLNPRTEPQQGYFEIGLILKNGFVPEENRARVFGNSDGVNEFSMFKEDPLEIIQKLAEIRNYGIISKFAHHLLILLRGRRPIEYR